MICRECGEEFTSRPGKPGYVNVCLDCTERDVPLLKAEVSWENKHTPIIRVTDTDTANRFNRQLARHGTKGLLPALASSAKFKSMLERKGERKTDQGARGYYKGK